MVRSLLLEIFSSGVEDNQPAKGLGKGNPFRKLKCLGHVIIVNRAGIGMKKQHGREETLPK